VAINLLNIKRGEELRRGGEKRKNKKNIK